MPQGKLIMYLTDTPVFCLYFRETQSSSPGFSSRVATEKCVFLKILGGNVKVTAADQASKVKGMIMKK